MAVYTTIDDASAHFQTTLYTGNGSDDLSITNGGNSDLQPDLVWIKNRAKGDKDHILYDSSRGVTKQLHSNNNNAEGTVSGLTDFNSDGFTIDDDGGANTDGDSHVAWQWKGNAGSTSSVGASGSGASQILASTYQVNTTAGFSIVLYTGTGEDATVSHGLGAVPDVLLFKKRSTDNWYMYHSANTAAPETDYMTFDTTAATTDFDIWNDTAPTSTVFSISNAGVHANTTLMVCWAWREIQGYSRFGYYEGNANADGPFIYTGFKPGWLLIKQSSASGENWRLFDSARSTYNQVGNHLVPSTTGAESAETGCDFLSNGFKLRDADAHQNSASTYIYMSFAEQPFVTSGGVPCTAR